MRYIILFCLFPVALFAQNPLPVYNSSMFTTSGNCATCHTGSGTVLTQNGVDISPVTHWRSTMMANASKDPLWQAVVSEETHRFPGMKDEIESICTKCHAPMGNTQAKKDGLTTYTLAQMRSDPLGKDGVSCTTCHQIDPQNLGSQSSYNGGYKIDTTRIIYGPYQNPFAQPMINFVNFNTQYSPHVNNSELCATCHTLYTPYFDDNNQMAGYFSEQTPYIEWKNSNFEADGTECQTCHMPSIQDSMDISTIPAFHTAKHSPYYKHEFAGGNKMMLTMLKNNIDSLGVTASAELFDSTIGRIDANFYNKTALLDIDVIPGSDSIDIKVLTTNLTGHKLPTGIPFRRMWIHLKVMNSNSEIIFESGKWGSDGEVIGHDTPFEPHYDIIRAQDQIQIYEGVFIDVNGQVTQTLLRAAEYVKDNRLPPAGFTTSHISYDSVKITGINGDENFNKLANVEGTGSDIVTYRIDPLTNGELTITAELCYQTMKPAAIQNLASVGSPESIKFLDMWQDEDHSPSIITSKSETFVVTSTEGENEQAVKDEFIYIYPNPSKGDMTFSFQLKTSQNVEISIFNPLGEKVKNILSGLVDPGKQTLNINTKSLSTGVYFLVMKTQSGVRSVKVVIVR